MKKRPLKISKTGMEIEFFILDEQGNVSNKADFFIEQCKKADKSMTIKKECSKTMVELYSYPNVKVYDSAAGIIKNLLKVIEVAEENNFVIFPNATYPAKVEPVMRKKDWWYNTKHKFLGEEKFRLTGLCAGFHNHYTLPRGVFDKRKKFLKTIGQSKIKQTLIDSYNLSIAMDPALTVLTQSSPFIQGRYYGKDSREIVYRGGRKLKSKEGVYSSFQQLGGLPPYKQTLSDLLFSIKKRKERFKRTLVKKGFSIDKKLERKNILDFAWNPVRINKLGTLEQRGMDMTHPKYIIAVSSLLKFIHRKIQQEFMHIVPADFAIDEPFKIEGNIIYIPPHTYVRNKLQLFSAYGGFDNSVMSRYVDRFFRFAKSLTSKDYEKIIKPLKDMIDRKQSVSDIILKKLKKKGYNRRDNIPTDVFRSIALSSSRQLYYEVYKIKCLLEGLN